MMVSVLLVEPSGQLQASNEDEVGREKAAKGPDQAPGELDYSDWGCKHWPRSVKPLMSWASCQACSCKMRQTRLLQPT